MMCRFNCLLHKLEIVAVGITAVYVLSNKIIGKEHGSTKKLPYFPAHKTHRGFFVRNLRKKNNDEFILILVIYWKKTGLLRIKISNHNVIYSSYETQKIVVTATKIIFMVVFTALR